MRGHGTKFSRKKEATVAALLTQKNQEEAARAAGISVATLLRWQKVPEFRKAYREARRAAHGQSIARLRRGDCRDVSGKLGLKPTVEQQKRLAKRPTENAEAYPLCLKDRYYWNRRTEQTLKRAVEYFQQAIEIPSRRSDRSEPPFGLPIVLPPPTTLAAKKIALSGCYFFAQFRATTNSPPGSGP